MARSSYAVLMVCMGNICRSPTAEVVLRDKLRRAGLQGQVTVDSAGTHADWHRGEPPDRRAQVVARRRGYDLSALRARTVADADFKRFDLLLAMDEDNLAELQRRAPAEAQSKLRRLGEYLSPDDPPDVPDPYYGSTQAFEQVLDLVEQACDALVVAIGDEFRGRQQGTS